MNIALISVTKNGLLISKKIADRLCDKFSCKRYTFEKYPDENAVRFCSLSKLIFKLFCKNNALIFICACGIAVRIIAPCIVSKLTDPAVIVVDDHGNYVISLLSGHIGKANSLTIKIADLLDCTPVITTANDIVGNFSPDSFAIANHLHIYEVNLVKDIAISVLKGENIGIYSDYPLENTPDIFTSTANLGICISENKNLMVFEKTLHLVPKNVVIGVGCRRNTCSKLFENFVLKCLSKGNISLFKIREIHSVDTKKNEYAILRFAEKYRFPIIFHTAEELMLVNGDFESSEFVFKKICVDNICERSACISGGKLFMHKITESGMTFAAAEISVKIDFENKIL